MTTCGIKYLKRIVPLYKITLFSCCVYLSHVVISIINLAPHHGYFGGDLTPYFTHFGLEPSVYGRFKLFFFVNLVSMLVFIFEILYFRSSYTVKKKKKKPTTSLFTLILLYTKLFLNMNMLLFQNISSKENRQLM